MYEWFQSHCFQLNPGKTQATILGTKQALASTHSRTHSLIINGVNLPFQSAVKNLGVQIEQDLTWYTNSSNISKKVYTFIIFATMHIPYRLISN